MMAFGVGRRRRRVEIFRLGVADRSTAKGDNFARRRVRWNHQPVAIKIIIAPLPALYQSGTRRQCQIDAV
ncbi:MAG TPA: hypothetical protein VHR97_11695, partial [Candidatus Baltobacteraceae bacterium]|nr:hypothetical protein [Candidatus Baltobacteraceae bacterium]